MHKRILSTDSLKKNRLAFCAALGVMLSGSAVCSAAVVTWVPTGAGSWNVPANWSTSSLPGPSDTATFPNTLVGTGNAVTLDANQTVYAVNVAAGTGGKGIDIQAGSPASTLTVLSTDSSTDGSTTFYAIAATSGLTVIDAPVQLGNGSSGSFTATLFNSTNTSNSFVINGNISASAGQTWGVNIAGSGAANAIVQFNTNPKTYNGDTTVLSGGFLRVGVTDALPFGAGAGNLNINSGGTFNINNVNTDVNGLNGAGAITKAGSNTRTLTIGNNNASGSYSGSISLTGGSSGLTKTGTGTETLSGASQSIAGALTINGGTFLENGTITAASTSVAASGMLGGSGTMTGLVTVNGTIAPGSAASTIGTLTLNSGLTLGSAGGIYSDDINSAGASDLLAITGNLTINSADSLMVNVLDSASGGNYTIATYTGTLTGTFGTVNLPAGYSINYGTGSNSAITLNVPEPASAAILVLGLTVVSRRRRGK